MSKPGSILVVGPSWVGDMVMAQSLFIELARQRPGADIDVLAPAWSEPLLARMPEVRRSIPMPVGHGRVEMRARWRLGRELARNGYSQAIILPNSFKSALVPWFAGISRRTGWRGEMRYLALNDLRILDPVRYPLMVERFVALALASDAALPSPLPRPRLRTDSESAARLAQSFGLADAPFVAFCPGAEFGPSKRWPETHYAWLGKALIERGYRIALFGSRNDQPVAAAIVEALPPVLRERCVDLTGRTALAEAIDLLGLAALAVSNDSGLMHVAAALGRPLVALYGSTSPDFTPPLSDRVRIEFLPVDCGPCFQRHCPLGHHKCMRELMPSRVLAAANELLEAA